MGGTIRHSILTMVAIFLIGLSIDAGATPITFSDTGIGSGSLNGVNFSNSSFTITATDDTSNVVPFTNINHLGLTNNGYVVVNNSANIEIAGLGTYTFITENGFWVNPAYQGVGFSLISGTNQFLADLYDGPISSVFSSWDMQSSIGPVSGTANILSWTSIGPIQTSGGTIVLDQGSSPVTFTAEVDPAPVPEPTTIILLGAGLAVIGLVRRQKKV